MASPPPRLKIIDLLRQAKRAPSTLFLGREQELHRLASIIQRSSANNVLVSGQRGCGKSSLIRGFAHAVIQGKFTQLSALPYLQLSTPQLARLLSETSHKQTVLAHLAAALQSLPPSVIVIDDAEQLLEQIENSREFETLFGTMLTSPHHRLILIIESTAAAEFKDAYRRSWASFELVEVPEAVPDLCHHIVANHTYRLSRLHRLTITPTAVTAITDYAAQYTSDYALPARALLFLDEVCAACVLQSKTIVEPSDVKSVFAQRVGLPTLSASPRLQQLGKRLSKRVLGQDEAVRTVATSIQTAWLGLQSSQRPLATFLFLGPSGVGKTELAKALSSELFGSERVMLRLDMSEFSEPHTAQRLTGAPPGYIGYEAGGQLTDFVRRHPFSLILLDEIEKAHTTLFDLFLQVLDDSRLTDSHGQTVDFSKTIIIATSNLASGHIVAADNRGEAVTSSAWRDQALLPLLLQRFRAEFLNRFSALLVFRPLPPEQLLIIAKNEIKALEERFRDYHVTVAVSDSWLKHKISTLYNPLFGARPVKRFIQQTCETLLVNRLLKNPSP